MSNDTVSNDLEHAIAHARAGSHRLPHDAVDTALELLLACDILDQVDRDALRRADDLTLRTVPAERHIRQALEHLERLPRSPALDQTRRHLDDALVHLSPTALPVAPDPYLANAIAHVAAAEGHSMRLDDASLTSLAACRRLLEGIHEPTTLSVPTVTLAALPVRHHLDAAWSFTGFALRGFDHHPHLVEARITLFRIRFKLDTHR